MQGYRINGTNIWILCGLVAIPLVFAAVLVPNLLRSRVASKAAHFASLRIEKFAALQSASLATKAEFSEPEEPASPDRKLIRTYSLNLIVQSPAEIADKLRSLVESVGGFLVSSETAGGQDSANASLTVRVPVTHFEEIRAEIRKLGLRVENEKLDAQDVSRQYVDQEARLRNLSAEEVQYLGILKRASTVKDTLEATGKLSEVRGQIEQQQAEFNALSKQVETVAMSVSLYREADVRVFGLNWRPLYQLKMSAREGVLALGDYVASMTAFLLYLPAVLLWLATMLAAGSIGWRLVKWVARTFFGFPGPRTNELPTRS